MSQPPNPAEAMLQVMDGMKTVLETIAGYRKQCEEQGFSPTAAEVMALELHQAMLQSIFGLPPKK